MTGRSEWGDSHNRLIVCRDISTTHYVHRYNMLLGQPHTFFISIFHNCITPPRSDAWRVLTLPEDLSVAGFLPLSCLPARDIHLHTHRPVLRICRANCGSQWKGIASIGTPLCTSQYRRMACPVPDECHGDRLYFFHSGNGFGYSVIDELGLISLVRRQECVHLRSLPECE